MNKRKLKALMLAIWAFIKEISPTFITAFKKAKIVFNENK